MSCPEESNYSPLDPMWGIDLPHMSSNAPPPIHRHPARHCRRVHSSFLPLLLPPAAAAATAATVTAAATTAATDATDATATTTTDATVATVLDAVHLPAVRLAAAAVRHRSRRASLSLPPSLPATSVARLALATFPATSASAIVVAVATTVRPAPCSPPPCPPRAAVSTPLPYLLTSHPIPRLLLSSRGVGREGRGRAGAQAGRQALTDRRAGGRAGRSAGCRQHACLCFVLSVCAVRVSCSWPLLDGAWHCVCVW